MADRKDSSNDDSQKEPSDINIHTPLPYLVRLRVSRDDDSVADVKEVKVVAYSLFEAYMQAVFEATGTSGLEDGRCKIDSIGPDLETYAKIYENTIATALLALRKAVGV